MDWTRVRGYQYTPNQPATVEEFVCTVWTMVGPSGKPLTCELWRVLFGFELRLMRNGELYRFELARGPLADEELAADADE